MKTENNELIADFMGLEKRKMAGFRDGYIVDGLGWVSNSGLKYESSWSWIMPVIEKINGFDGACFRILGTDVRVNYKGKIVASCHTIDLKNSIYGAIVKFIKWYNKENG